MYPKLAKVRNVRDVWGSCQHSSATTQVSGSVHLIFLTNTKHTERISFALFSSIFVYSIFNREKEEQIFFSNCSLLCGQKMDHLFYVTLYIYISPMAPQNFTLVYQIALFKK